MDGTDDLAYSRSTRLLFGRGPSPPSTASPKDANPATELLQDMIREKRAQTQRTKKTYDPVSRIGGRENADGAHQESQSSPLTSANTRGRPSMTTRRSSGTNSKPVVQKEMGLREMSEHITKVDKQNFDLKLEVFHRRQRNDILEAKLAELEAREADYDDLQAKYTALLLESDRQKLILDDAVAQICELQSENEELQATIGGHFAGVSDLEPVSHTSNQILSVEGHSIVPATPAQVNGWHSQLPKDDQHSSVKSLRSTSSRRKLKTPPPRNGDNATVAGLHDLYSSRDGLNQENPSLTSVNRSGSVFSGDEEDIALDRQMLNSPRLSILSESGFSSIYGSPKDRVQASSLVDNDNSGNFSPAPHKESSPSRHSAQRDARIDLWIQEKPSSSRTVERSPKVEAGERYTSIEQVLQTQSSMPKEKTGVPRVEIPQRQSSSTRIANGSQRHREVRSPNKISTRRQRAHSSSNGSMTFGGKLPPTPDTMSTATIGGPSSSTQSIITEKSLLDHGHPPSTGYMNLVAYGRPRTTDSDFSHPAHHAHNGLNGLGFDDELGWDRSGEDEEVESTAVEQGDHGLPAASPFMGGPAHQDRLSGAPSHARPSLKSHQTDMMFNGEGFALIQPSRTFSYPSPRRSSQPSSAQVSPISHISARSQTGSGISEGTAPPSSPKYVVSAKEASTTPTKDLPRDDKSSYPTKQHLGQGSPLSAIVKQRHQEVSRPKSGRFQFFKRSTSHDAGNVLGAQATSPPRPQTLRSASTTRPQPDIPRHRSFNGSRPGTSDGSTPTILPRPSQSLNTRRHSAILDHAASFLPRATTSSDHNRRVSESRQIFGAEDSKSRWPLGRSTGVKIKEGLGLRRSQAS